MPVTRASEYVHLDNSACNLASLNLLTFLDSDGNFDVEGFKAAVEVVFTGQEILVGNADYPTKSIGDTSRRFRQLGLGYANLGALLMAQGLPYDSDGGRAWAGAITALMTGHAYTVSARTAARMGPFAGYHENREPMLDVLRMHRAEVAKIDEELVPPDLLSAAQEAWDDAVDTAERYGVRNSQASVLAPTGTIGLLMDCDTTGVEPDLGLVKTKKLVGGGTMSIVNQTVPRCPGQTRVLRARDRRYHGLYRRAQVDTSVRRISSRPPGRFCLLDGRQHHPLPRPRPDDGGSTAVHLGADLARRSTCPKRSRWQKSSDSISTRGEWASRPSPSTGTIARWPASGHDEEGRHGADGTTSTDAEAHDAELAHEGRRARKGPGTPDRGGENSRSTSTCRESASLRRSLSGWPIAKVT